MTFIDNIIEKIKVKKTKIISDVAAYEIENQRKFGMNLDVVRILKEGAKNGISSFGYRTMEDQFKLYVKSFGFSTSVPYLDEMILDTVGLASSKWGLSRLNNIFPQLIQLGIDFPDNTYWKELSDNVFIAAESSGLQNFM